MLGDLLWPQRVLLPGLLAVVILLTTHLAGRYPWRFDLYVLAGMLGESIIWTLPLFVLDRVLVEQHGPAGAPGHGPHGNAQRVVNEVVRSFGPAFTKSSSSG